MKKTMVTGLLASLLLSAVPAFAEDTIGTIAAPTAATAAQEWRSYVQPLESLGERFVPQMTDPQDPQLRRELYRALFSQISSVYLMQPVVRYLTRQNITGCRIKFPPMAFVTRRPRRTEDDLERCVFGLAC